MAIQYSGFVLHCMYKHTDNDCSLLYIQIKYNQCNLISELFFFAQNISSDISKMLAKYNINIRCTQQFLYFESRIKSLKQKKKTLAKETEFS